MDGENRRSREAVRNSIRTYGVKVMDPASLPLKKTTERESQESVSRFSEKSLHKKYRRRKGWTSRIPFATLVVTIFCFLGMLISAVTMDRTIVLTKNMFHDVFHVSDFDYDVLRGIFILLNVASVIMVLMILILTVLLTGDTRNKVFKGRKLRTAGWVLCLVFMVLLVFCIFYWILFFGMGCTLGILVYTVINECSFRKSKECMKLTVLNLFFEPEERHFKVCGDSMVNKVCKDYTDKVGTPLTIMIVTSAILIFGLAILLACMAGTYTRVRKEVKTEELEELRH